MKKFIAVAIVGAFALGTFVGVAAMSVVADNSNPAPIVVNIERDFAGYKVRSNEINKVSPTVASTESPNYIKINPAELTSGEGLRLNVRNASQFRNHSIDPVAVEIGERLDLDVRGDSESPRHVKINPAELTSGEGLKFNKNLGYPDTGELDATLFRPW